ncbi:TonB-dependent siderophore receptor [Psychrobacter sp. BI730]|uniref:TonB-dependent receptor n=1 Tax=Psychrobacter sp. BI730 TaxID=2705463 RepID=UPI0015CBF425|nr:TonB-dependent siderophore receptor [Psychrobacter sp. BI730]NYR10565.1 TonB-dependent siderophore receptor [Psychrobacter sp. BI730]
MSQLQQHSSQHPNVKQSFTEHKPFFVLNYFVSAKLALLCGAAAGTVFLGMPAAYAQTNGTPVSSTEATDMTITAQNQSTEADQDLPTVTLPAITVEADAEENSNYAGGQVTYTNNMGFLGNKDFLDTPFSAISYTDKFIADQQAVDITDVIAATDPAVYTSGASGESLESYYIRGFASSSNDVTVNGLTGMAPYYRSSPEMFERVEVLKGPSAMLNGMSPNGSIGGSVNLVTKRAGDEPLTQLTTRYLSDSQLGAHVDIGRRFGEDKQFGVRVNGAYREGDSAVDDQEKQAQSAAIALDWRGERARVSADLYTTTDHVDGPTRGVTLASGVDIPSVPDPDTLLNPSWAYFETQTKGAIGRAEFDINDQLTTYASMGVTKWNYDGLSADNAQISNTDGDISTTVGYVGDDNERQSFEVGLNGQFQTGNIGHQIAVNATRYEEKYNLYAARFRGVSVDTNIYDPVWGSRPDLDLNPPLLTATDTELTSYGIADTLSFDQDKYQLTLGARYQQLKTEQTGGMLSTGTKYDENAITPSVALSVKITDQTSLYANYIEGLSKGATAPTDAENAGEIFAPYKTKQKEVGIKIDLGNFSHTLSAYEIEKPNGYTDTDTNIFSYAGAQRNRGVEWGVFGSPAENVRLMGGISYIDAKLTKMNDGVNEGNQAAGVPKWQSKIGVEWDLPLVENLTLTANANAVSKQYLENDNIQSLPGRTIYGVGARYLTSVNDKPLTLRGSVENVMNKAYWTTAHYNDLAIGEPRTFLLSATMDF